MRPLAAQRTNQRRPSLKNPRTKTLRRGLGYDASHPVDSKQVCQMGLRQVNLKWSCFLGQLCGIAKMLLVAGHAAFRIFARVKYAVSGVRLSRAV